VAYRLIKIREPVISRLPRASNKDPTAGLRVRLYGDAAVEFIGLDDSRLDDKFIIGVGYAHVSKRAQRLEGDYQALVSPSWAGP